MVTVSKLINNENQKIFRGMFKAWFLAKLKKNLKLNGGKTQGLSCTFRKTYILPEILQPNFDFVIDPKRSWPTRLVSFTTSSISYMHVKLPTFSSHTFLHGNVNFHRHVSPQILSY